MNNILNMASKSQPLGQTSLTSADSGMNGTIVSNILGYTECICTPLKGDHFTCRSIVLVSPFLSV